MMEGKPHHPPILHALLIVIVGTIIGMMIFTHMKKAHHDFARFHNMSPHHAFPMEGSHPFPPNPKATHSFSAPHSLSAKHFHLTKEMLQFAEKNFEQIDTSGDGKISIDEVHQFHFSIMKKHLHQTPK